MRTQQHDSMHMDDDLQTSSSLRISRVPTVVSVWDVMPLEAEQAYTSHHACLAGMSVALPNALWQA